MRVCEGSVKVLIAVKATWHCSLLASAEICEGSVKIAAKVKSRLLISQDVGKMGFRQISLNIYILYQK